MTPTPKVLFESDTIDIFGRPLNRKKENKNAMSKIQ
jgi:hypothetical protein